jgi:hypothetical protein
VCHVLRFTPDAVLRAEQSREFPTTAGVEQTDCVPQIARHRALIRDQTDSLSGDRLRIVEENLQSRADGH